MNSTLHKPIADDYSNQYISSMIHAMKTKSQRHYGTVRSLSSKPEHKKYHNQLEGAFNENSHLVITKYQMYINPRKPNKIQKYYKKAKQLSDNARSKERLFVEKKSFGLQTQFEDVNITTDDGLLKSNTHSKETIEFPEPSHVVKRTLGIRVEQIKSLLPKAYKTKHYPTITSRNLHIQGGSIAPFQTQFRTNIIKRACHEKRSRVILGAKKFSLQPDSKTLNAYNTIEYRRNTIGNISVRKPKEFITLSLRKGKLIKGISSGPKLINRLRVLRKID